MTLEKLHQQLEIIFINLLHTENIESSHLPVDLNRENIRFYLQEIIDMDNAIVYYNTNFSMYKNMIDWDRIENTNITLDEFTYYKLIK